jgi:DNA-binding IclR family transcriptional regulator
LTESGSRTRGRPRRVAEVTAPGDLDPSDPFVVRAFWKGLQVLGLFDADHPEWTIMEVAAATGIPRATAYRLARTLEAADYLVLDSLTGRYHLGPAAVALTYLSRNYSELARMARPHLEALANETGETVNLAVEIDGKAVLVDEKRTPRPFKSEVPVGRIIGDIANSNGKIFAAFKSEGDRQNIASSPHQPLTPHTIVDREALLAEFERVRREGIAYDIEERSLGVCAVGAPVRDQAGSVEAAISLVVPKGRFGPEEKERYAEAVRRTAASLSAFLGYSPPEG